MAHTQLPTAGDLAEIPLPRMLLDLASDRFTGAMRLERDRTTKSIHFQKGAPVASESNLASEQLGTQLLYSGRISAEDHARITDYITSRGCREGVALLSLELLQPKELFLALKDQVRQRVVACFGWPGGRFELRPEEEGAKEVQPFRCDLYTLVQEGLATHWGAERMLADLTDRLAQYAQPVAACVALAQRPPLPPAVETLLEALDGSRTFAQAMGARGNEPTTLAAAWLLSHSGHLRFSDSPVAARAGDSAEATVAEIEIEVADGAATPKARKQSGAKTSSGSAKDQKEKARRAEELRKEIEQKREHLAELEHYAVLGVDADAESSEIKRAYFKAAKRYHPDALARLDLEDMKEAASEVFARIAEAYEVLSDADKREFYDDSLLDDGPEIDAYVVAQAETFYRKGEILLGMGNFRDALEYLQNAVDVWPDENAYQSDLGWAFYKKRPSEPDKAKLHLELALELDPSDGIGHFRLGLVLRSLGDTERADELLETAKQLDPQVG